MKKLIYCALALATGLFATSCLQENLEPAQSGTTVTYTVNVPEVATKAVGEADNVNNLVYAVYRVIDNTNLSDKEAKENLATNSGNYHLMYQEDTPVRTVDGKKKAYISLELINDQRYVVIFWAQKDYTWFNEGQSFTSVAYPTTLDGNNDAYDAFTGVDVITVDRPISKDITLVRPFAQLNIATVVPGPTTEYPDRYTDFQVATTGVVVTGVAQSFNVGAQVGETVGEVTFSAVAPLQEGFTNSQYPEYLSMNYVFVPANQSNVTVSYDINTNSYGTVENTVPNVPLARNYRTNIIGNLLTSEVDYNVELAPWYENSNSGTTEVIVDGLVMNQKGDYEITNENGLACAMNTLFTLGGDFYLTKELYDMTGYDVTSPSVPEGVTLRIFGETPIVTRSTVSVDGITIKGLKDALIDVVKGNVFISGVNLPDTGSVLVNNNQGGNVIVTETTATELVAEGDAAVEADNVKNLATLEAALASEDVKVIEITADIEATEFISISRSVTINGNGHKLISSASRIIRFQKNKGIEVTFNDLHGVSTAKFVYGSIDSIRGFSVDSEVHDMLFTLNNCSVDFTDESATDWSYAINLVSSENNTIIINGGTYEGANVINVWGNNHNISVDNAVLTSIYAYNTQYVGCCFRIENSNNKITAKNCAFNGNHAVVTSESRDAENNEFIFENNIDNTMSYSDGVYYVASAEKLQTAINNAKEGTNKIVLTNNIVGNVTLIQKENVKFTINGDDHKYNGTIKIHSNSNHYTTSAVTVENINFETATPSLNFIEALENGSERYSTNITVQECTFTATGDAVNTAVGLQIKSSNNAKVLNCTSTDMHSMVQANSCNSNVEVKGCTINGKGGVSFTQVKEATVENCTITASGYGIRYDGRKDNYGITVKNNNITATQPFIARKMTGANNTITLEGENTLTTEKGYQVIVTNGSDDEKYVEPTGTYTLTGVENFIVYPRDYAVCTSAELQAALKAKAPKIYIAADITISEKWDNRYTGSKTSHAIEIDGLGHTLKFTGEVSDGSNYHAAFRFENTATVKNLIVDMSEVAGTGTWLRAISSAGELVVDNCTFNGSFK